MQDVLGKSAAIGLLALLASVPGLAQFAGSVNTSAGLDISGN